MSHLLKLVARPLSQKYGPSSRVEMLLRQRRSIFRTLFVSSINRCIVARKDFVAPSTSNCRAIFQNGHLRSNHTRRWYSPTADHVKNFNFIADAVEIASPAVVYVDVQIQQQGGLFGGGGVAQGAGSGFIVTDYGMILTNAHVVNNATSVAVKLPSNDVSNNFNAFQHTQVD